MMYFFVAVFFLLVACGESGPAPIQFGSDQCAYCRMTISDKKFASELITSKGKPYKFDSPECLFRFFSDETVETRSKVASLWVTNYKQPGELIDAKSAFYLQNPEFRSPMGLNIAAFKTEADVVAMFERYPGKRMEFSGVFIAASGR